MKIERRGNTSLYRFDAGNSTFIMNPFEGARLMTWDIKNADGTSRSVIPWQKPEIVTGKDFPTVHGGIPIIFPFPSTSFVGRTPHIWRTPRGDVRPMARFGYAWGGKFEVAYSSDNEIKLKFIPCADCKEAYPYDYNFYVRYRFFGRSFTLELLLENKGDLPMPWEGGTHPYFTIPWVKGEKKRDYFLQSDGRKSTYNVGDGTRQTLDNLDKNSFADPELKGRILCDLQTGTVKAVRKKTGEAIEIIINDNRKPDPSFAVVFFGFPKEGDPNIFAIEPWMAPPNSASKPSHFVRGGETGSFKIEVKI